MREYSEGYNKPADKHIVVRVDSKSYKGTHSGVKKGKSLRAGIEKHLSGMSGAPEASQADRHE